MHEQGSEHKNTLKLDPIGRKAHAQDDLDEGTGDNNPMSEQTGIALSWDDANCIPRTLSSLHCLLYGRGSLPSRCFAHTGIVPSGFGYKILFICNTDTFLMNMNKPSLYLYLHV